METRNTLFKEWKHLPNSVIHRKDPSLSLLAGFSDAEGSFNWWLSHRKNPKLRLMVAQKRRRVLDYLRSQANSLGQVSRRKQNGVHVWTLTDQVFLRELNPYLKIKRMAI